MKRGSPIFHLRLSPVRRKLWDQAAKIKQLPVSTYIKDAVDAHAEQTIEMDVKGETK